MAPNSIIRIDVCRLNHTETLGTFISLVGFLDEDLSGKDLNVMNLFIFMVHSDFNFF